MLTLAVALAPVHQGYLLEARQMQALSFAVHIPLVAFRIAFPAMILFVEWLHGHTGGRQRGRSRVRQLAEPDLDRVGVLAIVPRARAEAEPGSR